MISNAPNEEYLLALANLEVIGQERSQWFGTSAGCAELDIPLGGAVSVAALLAADELLGPTVEIQFTAPVSVSTVWALGEDTESIAEAHDEAVIVALASLGIAIQGVPIAANYRHVVARLPRVEDPPPQLHTHALVLAIDIDEPPDELVTVAPAGSVAGEPPPRRAKLGFVPQRLDELAPGAGEMYVDSLARRLGTLGYPVDRRSEFVSILEAIRAKFEPRPCGAGRHGRAVPLATR